MLYSAAKDIEDRIIEMLIERRLTIKSLYATLGANKKVSLRGVYKAVDKLIGIDVLLKVGKQVMINQEWAGRVSERLRTAPTVLLAKNERLVYTFVSLEHVDTFWKSTVLPLERSVPSKEAFFYNPHSFWAHLPTRTESEEVYFNHFTAEQVGFLTIGGGSAADLEFKRRYQHEYLQIDTKNTAAFRRTDHVTIHGPYVITTRLSKATSEQIDTLYATGKQIDEILPDIMRICEKPGKIRFVLENNPTKATKLRRILSRNFYFKRPES